MKYIYPHINITIRSLKDFQDKELAETVISTINSYGKGFIPEKYDLYEPLKRKYSVKSSNDVVSLWMNYEVNERYRQNGENIAAGQVIMGRKKGHYLSWHIFWEKSNEKKFNWLSLTIGIDFLKKVDNYSKFMELCKKLINIIEPVCGEITNENFPNHSQPVDLEIRLPEVQWGLILGKPYIEMFTREKILSCPCHSVAELNNCVLIQSTAEVFKEVPIEARERIKRHLGENAFVWDGKRALVYKTKENLVPTFDF